ncbi:flagellar hook-length control protein FliK [Tabrizicola sp.]|uniref:flagellar hook-length control protein FliK n=1 Tax=Tabrizicola sp. TaxID=2005166 RepID=UPI0035B41793
MQSALVLSPSLPLAKSGAGPASPVEDGSCEGFSLALAEDGTEPGGGAATDDPPVAEGMVSVAVPVLLWRTAMPMDGEAEADGPVDAAGRGVVVGRADRGAVARSSCGSGDMVLAGEPGLSSQSASEPLGGGGDWKMAAFPGGEGSAGAIAFAADTDGEVAPVLAGAGESGPGSRGESGSPERPGGRPEGTRSRAARSFVTAQALRAWPDPGQGPAARPGDGGNGGAGVPGFGLGEVAVAGERPAPFLSGAGPGLAASPTPPLVRPDLPDDGTLRNPVAIPALPVADGETILRGEHVAGLQRSIAPTRMREEAGIGPGNRGADAVPPASIWERLLSGAARTEDAVEAGAAPMDQDGFPGPEDRAVAARVASQESRMAIGSAGRGPGSVGAVDSGVGTAPAGGSGAVVSAGSRVPEAVAPPDNTRTAAAPNPGMGVPALAAPDAAPDLAPAREVSGDPGLLAAGAGLPAPLAAAVGPGPAAPPMPVPQLVARMAAALNPGAEGETELALSPEELGHVRVKLKPDAANPERLVVMITFERPETLDLFRRHAGELADAFRSAGYAGADIGFGQQGDRQPGTDGHEGGTGQVFDGISRPDPAAPSHASPRLLGAASLDLRL